MEGIRLVLMFRTNEGTKQRPKWGEWKWESSVPMWNQLWVANMVNNYNERRAAFRGACEYKLEVGKIGKNNEIIRPTEDELLDINKWKQRPPR